MIIKSATIFCLIALAHSATIRQADIPVEIRYDANKSTGTELNVSGEDTLSNDILKSSDANVGIDVKTVPVEPLNTIDEASVNQLDGKSEEKLPVIIENTVPFKKLPEDVKIEEVEQKISEKPATEEKQEQIQEESKPVQDQPSKTVDDVQKPEEQKIEVLPEEPTQALKSVIPEQTILEIKPKDNKEKLSGKDEKENEASNDHQEKQQDSINSQPNEMQLRGISTEIMSGVEQVIKKKEELVNKIVEKTGEKLLTNPNSLKYETLFGQAQEIVAKGLKQLKESVTLKSGSKQVDWESLEKRVNAYFDEEKRKLQTKEEQQPPNENFFSNMINSIQSITAGFLPGNQNQGGNNPVSNEGSGTGGQGAGVSAGPFNQFINFINQGFSTISSQLGGGPSTSNTVLGDATTSAPSIIQSIISGIQNIGSGFTGGQQSGQTVSQGEAGTGQQPPQNPILQQIGNAFNAFRPPQVVSGEAGTGQPANIISTITQGVNNAISTFIPGAAQASGAANQVTSPTKPVAAPPAENEGSKKPQSSAQSIKPEDAPVVAVVALPEKVSLPEKVPIAEKPLQPVVITAQSEKTEEQIQKVAKPVKLPDPIKLPEIQKPVQEVPAEKPLDQPPAKLPVSPIASNPQPSSNTPQGGPEKEQKN